VLSGNASPGVTVGVPAETKAHEYRVAITPAGVRELVDARHEVLIERGAGAGAAIADAEYAEQGARLVADAATVFAEAELVVKVKEPLPDEIAMLRVGQTLFTYLHLAADRALTEGLLASGATCVAYETVVDGAGRLPLLTPMSQVAGRLAAEAAADAQRRSAGGRGVLMGGIPGVAPAVVVVVGAGTVGGNAAAVAAGMGAEVHVLDRDPARLREIDERLAGRVFTHHATALALEHLLPEADAVIGAVLVAGARAPWVVRREHLQLMREGAVLVDVSIDQGGCFETSRPTTHAEPTYVVEGVIHYCVANMPGVVPVTATRGLTNATLPYVLALANTRESAFRDDAGLAAGLAIHAGKLTSRPVAEAFELDSADPASLIAA
jgi:alanine dehydrogenase